MDGVEIFLRAAANRFLARTMCDSTGVGVAEYDDTALLGMGTWSLGGPCSKGIVEVVRVGIGAELTEKEWEVDIERVR